MSIVRGLFAGPRAVRRVPAPEDFASAEEYAVALLAHGLPGREVVRRVRAAVEQQRAQHVAAVTAADWKRATAAAMQHDGVEAAYRQIARELGWSEAVPAEPVRPRVEPFGAGDGSSYLS